MKNGMRRMALFSLVFVLMGVQCVVMEAVAAGAAPVEIPLGQSAQVNDDNLFGLEGGYFHPYITLNLEYTDNLYNIDVGKKESLITTISPGIWFALPRKKIIPVTITPHNSSPGGLQQQFEDYSGTDRYQAYALGGLDFKYYSEDSDLNDTTGILEGMARLNMRGGLALQLVDRYTLGEDKFEIGSQARNQVKEFKSNFLMATADWDFTEKLRVQFDYFNFFLGYDDQINQFLDRTDNGIDLYGYFKYSLTTSFFLQYKYVDVAYDESELINNNSQFYYGGIKWDTTEKLAILAKAGYQMKKFDNSSLGQEDVDAFVFDVQFDYRFSEKTLFNWDIYRTNEETDNYLATDKTVVGSKFTYSQKFTERWSGNVALTYEYSDYSSLPSGRIKDREDTIWGFRPALQYLFRDWLMFEAAYLYDYRDSTDNLFDYDTNIFMVNANLSL